MEGLAIRQEERAGERSERSERSETALSRVESPGESEVLERASRRRFTREYKLRILEEAERCRDSLQRGLLLRREGLYSWHLTTWRKWRNAMNKGASRRTESIKKLRDENARLQRENIRLQLKLKRAEGLIALQKKIAQMMEEAPDDLSAAAQAGSKGTS
jgi:transposase-like protein